MSRRVKKVLTITVNILAALLATVALLFIFYSLSERKNNGVPEVLGYKSAVVLSGSMKGERPDSFDTGSLMFFKTVDVNTLNEGDVITFWDNIGKPGEKFQRALNSHRIVDIERDQSGALLFTTRGDANSLNDTEKRRAGDILGRYTGHISGGGRVVEFLQSSWGFFFCLVLPLALFFMWRLVMLIRAAMVYARERREERELSEAAAFAQK